MARTWPARSRGSTGPCVGFALMIKVLVTHLPPVKVVAVTACLTLLRKPSLSFRRV